MSQEHLRPQEPDCAAADDDGAPRRQELGRPQHASERLDPDAVELAQRRRKRYAVRRAQVLAEPSGIDPRRLELAARRRVARTTPLARAARDAVDDGDPVAVLELPLDLVPEHGSGRSSTELLDVGPAQPAGAHADEQPRPPRLGQGHDLRKTGVVEGDRAHPALHYAPPAGL